jgi:hypothetical protein
MFDADFKIVFPCITLLASELQSLLASVHIVSNCLCIEVGYITYRWDKAR